MELEVELKLLERLDELRRWQLEQQERLLKQQQEQRELLSFEQDRMYQALGLSMQGISIDEALAERILSPNKNGSLINGSNDVFKNDSNDREHFSSSDVEERSTCAEMSVEGIDKELRVGLNVPPLQLGTNRYLNYKSSSEAFSPRSEIPSENEQFINTVETPEKNYQHIAELSMEGVEPLPSDKPPNKLIALDDLPVPSPKKDFTTLLEERLRDCDPPIEINTGKNVKKPVKRPFLRKGEGLARFRPNPSRNACEKRTRPRSTSLSNSTHVSSGSVAKSNTNKLKDTPKSSKVATISGKNIAIPPVAQTKLSLKNVAPPKKKVRSKSMSAVPVNKSIVNTDKVKTTTDLNNSSDLETKHRRELDEMRIFELLEEKAENSSFCSNSSAVLALFRQSTPLKTKYLQKNIRDPKNRLLNESLKNNASDTSLEEIVRTSKTNQIKAETPITKIRETVIQKDFVFSKWDAGNLPDEKTDSNLSPNNSNRGMHRGIAGGRFKTMQHTKHTTIQFNNNNSNSNNNNNNVHMPVIHSDDDENVCDVSCNKNENTGENYCDATDKKENIDDLPLENAGTNVSLHVRFSEYNEYKTIGLTDTSMISNDSNPPRHYIEDKAWSDRSTSPDSSDVEVLFTKDIPKIYPKLEIVSKALPPLSQKIEQHSSCGNESTDQTTDDEQYTSTCSNDTTYEEDNTMSEMNVGKEQALPTKILESEDESEVCNDSNSTIRQDTDDVPENVKAADSVDVNGTIFKSELLKSRLLELEREIDIFRKENAALATQRKKIQEEQRLLQKEYKQKEEQLEMERKCAEESMQEEKKRVAREKAALENRLRDAREKSLQSKQERQEIQILREQLDELREDASQKESRWLAAQARQKSQIRVLQTENAQLKQELENLRQLKRNNVRTRRNAVPSNTRAIHQINKQLDNKKKSNTRKDSSSDEEITRSQATFNEREVEIIQAAQGDQGRNVVNDENKMVFYESVSQQPMKSQEDLRKKREMYANLLSDATKGMRGSEEILGKSVDDFEIAMNQSSSTKIQDKHNRLESGSVDSVNQPTSDNSFKRIQENTTENYQSTLLSKNEENTAPRKEKLSRSPVIRINRPIQDESKRSTEITPSKNERGNSTVNNLDIREVQCPDGHLEYWYPNGNVKKVFPDRNVKKMIYYNGDVRESTEDGSVKYFYASTRTWHTTLPDGLEILEFPDGQIERRSKNGTTEVSFPDGSVRLLQSDGTEKWVLPDGTIAETFPDGNKILSFPNGQREVHTKEHKRREYPDGTVKLVYPDGVQETRYSTGRVRVKDKDGNLLMDVHHR